MTRTELLETQLIEARIRIRHLEKELGKNCLLPRAFKLTDKEEGVLGILYKRDSATKNAIILTLYEDNPVGDKILNVYIWKLRTKLRPFGIEILTHWGRGYSIPIDSKEKINALLKAEELVSA